MATSNNLTNSLNQIAQLIESTRGNSDQFAETLRQKRIPHLSFSQITTVEFCHYRFFLQYIEMVDPNPIPDYFTKGKLVHQMIAKNYQKAANNQEIRLNDILYYLKHNFQEDMLNHLTNAMIVHLNNFWENCQVIAIEEPFAMIVEDSLPPCVGVIDLILKQGDHFIVVDHKTGRDFYPQDELQMAIYVEYIKRKYNVNYCRFYYDHYRWVNNLDRIRKPAFERTQVSLPVGYWQTALQRMKTGNQKILNIKNSRFVSKNGECFRCPYRSICR